MNLKRFILATITSLFLAAPALADSVSLNGAITTAHPTLPVVFISTPNCTAQGITPVRYVSHPFTVTASGSYQFSLLSDAGFASLYIFSPTFDPANPFPTCIAGGNSGNPVVLNLALTAGTQYFAVPFDDTFDQLGGVYNLSVAGPGTILMEGAHSLAIPTLSTLGLGALGALFLVAGLGALRRRSPAG